MSTNKTPARVAIMLAATLLAAACGGSADSAAGDATGAGSSDGAASSGESSGGESSDGGTAGDVALDTSPIPFRDLYDYRDGSEPVVRTEAVQLEDCPLLSLETLNASTGTYTNPTSLGEANAQRCTFNNGPAFSFSVSVEPAAGVDVDNHSGRAYNIDVEPVVEPQSGPGEKAVILIDTAFAETSGDEGTRYLYFFVLDDQAVTLRSSAFKIKDDGWRALADEVAANLASGAAGGEVETTEVADEVAPYTIEPCGFVTTEQIAALAGFDPADITAEFNPDRYQCRWSHPEALSLSVSFSANSSLYSESVGGANGEDRRDELGILAVGPPVLFNVWLTPDSVAGFRVNADSELWYGAADALAINLAQRIGEPPF